MNLPHVGDELEPGGLVDPNDAGVSALFAETPDSLKRALHARRSGATMLPGVLRLRLRTVGVGGVNTNSVSARPCESRRGRWVGAP
jgi:hypothetical protein